MHSPAFSLELCSLERSLGGFRSCGNAVDRPEWHPFLHQAIPTYLLTGRGTSRTKSVVRMWVTRKAQ